MAATPGSGTSCFYPETWGLLWEVCFIFYISRDLKDILTPGVVGTSTKDADTLFYCQTLFNSEEDTEVHIQVMLPG